jgi:hypothetical protein
MELVCVYCDHARRSHSRKGCTHSDKNLKPCRCNESFTNKDSFVLGTPKND